MVIEVRTYDMGDALMNRARTIQIQIPAVALRRTDREFMRQRFHEVLVDNLIEMLYGPEEAS